MRLTADLILQSPSVRNPCGDRELDLRGHKISVIENLGVTQDQYDCIDFTDNEILKLDGFPLFKRLKMLLIGHNQISSIAVSLAESLPNLEHLNLSHNNISSIGELESFKKFSSLKMLSLMGNPVTLLDNYRLYLIFTCPKLKILDFTKVTHVEKRNARMMFNGEKGKSALESTVSQSSKPDQRVAGSSQNQISKPDATKGPEADKIRNVIVEAKTLSEIQELRRRLQEGKSIGDLQTEQKNETAESNDKMEED